MFINRAISGIKTYAIMASSEERAYQEALATEAIIESIVCQKNGVPCGENAVERGDVKLSSTIPRPRKVSFDLRPKIHEIQYCDVCRPDKAPGRSISQDVSSAVKKARARCVVRRNSLES